MILCRTLFGIAILLAIQGGSGIAPISFTIHRFRRCVPEIPPLGGEGGSQSVYAAPTVPLTDHLASIHLPEELPHRGARRGVAV